MQNHQVESIHTGQHKSIIQVYLVRAFIEYPLFFSFLRQQRSAPNPLHLSMPAKDQPIITYCYWQAKRQVTYLMLNPPNKFNTD